MSEREREKAGLADALNGQQGTAVATAASAKAVRAKNDRRG